MDLLRLVPSLLGKELGLPWDPDSNAWICLSASTMVGIWSPGGVVALSWRLGLLPGLVACLGEVGAVADA